MNVQKLIKVSWKQTVVFPPHGRTDYIIRYYVLYERLNHIVNEVFKEITYDNNTYQVSDGFWDGTDVNIFNALYHHFYQAGCRNELRIEVDSSPLLLAGIADREKALLTQRAIGRQDRPLTLHNFDRGQSIRLHSRTYFSDRADIQDQINPLLPQTIILPPGDEEIFRTILNPDFISLDEVNRILDRNI